MNKLNPSIRHHLLIGIFIGFWIFVFTFYIKPFDTGIAYIDWESLSIGFSILAFICYSITAILQNIVYKKLLKWNTSLEIGTVLFFYILNLVFTYYYYKSPVLRGSYSFFDFANLMIQSAIVFIPVVLLLVIPKTMWRYFFSKMGILAQSLFVLLLKK